MPLDVSVQIDVIRRAMVEEQVPERLDYGIDRRCTLYADRHWDWLLRSEAGKFLSFPVGAAD
jgi:hypothetical protein